MNALTEIRHSGILWFTQLSWIAHNLQRSKIKVNSMVPNRDSQPLVKVFFNYYMPGLVSMTSFKLSTTGTFV